MHTPAGHLTYCTNIHAGESWTAHFEALRENFPAIKKALSPDEPMGMGLRLSNEASLELIEPGTLAIFKAWLAENHCYVFTLNGFPYGGFHRTRVKEQVHTPDWTTEDRVAYTVRIFKILENLLPEGMDGGVSTSPMGYRRLFTSPEATATAKETATQNMLYVAAELIAIRKNSGKMLHLDIEPEPDGLLETGKEFMDWFEMELLPAGIPFIAGKMSVSKEEAEIAIKEHIRLCYDVCHFAIGYEPHAEVIEQLREKGIKIGKIQISAALKASFAAESGRPSIRKAFEAYNEAVYLHQVVAKKEDGTLLRYPDLPEALADFDHPSVTAWRAHFHVPIFLKDFGAVQSTQEDISEVLALQNRKLFTQHLEIETYTWEVLPAALKLPLCESIIRELLWVKEELSEVD